MKPEKPSYDAVKPGFDAAKPGYDAVMAAATAPLKISVPEYQGCGGSHVAPRLYHHHHHHHHGKRNLEIAPSRALQVVINVLVPPGIFFGVTLALTFSWHFFRATAVWIGVVLSFVPALWAWMALQKARRKSADTRWPLMCLILCLNAAVVGIIVGQLTYWTFLYPFFFLQSMKTYSNVDPSQVTGWRLMDAGKIHFAENVRLATDMGMSYTNWDVYCVAPITTGSGLPSQSTSLATYDLWAVGVNCCRSADSNFHCGEYNNINARAGLRQVDESHRMYFNLAVEQAKAAYNIQSEHPLFFYWVQDPDRQVSHFFSSGFRVFVMSNLVFTTVLVLWVASCAVSEAREIASSKLDML